MAMARMLSTGCSKTPGYANQLKYSATENRRFRASTPVTFAA